MDRRKRGNTTITWTNVTGAGTAPDTDTIIDIRNAVTIAIQVNAAADSNHTAADWDLNVITCPTSDGTYDTTPYVSFDSFGDDAIKTQLVTPGPSFMKLTLDENAAARADVTAIVSITYETE